MIHCTTILAHPRLLNMKAPSASQLFLFALPALCADSIDTGLLEKRANIACKIVTAAGANCRTGPGLQYPVQRVLPYGSGTYYDCRVVSLGSNGCPGGDW